MRYPRTATIDAIRPVRTQIRQRIMHRLTRAHTNRHTSPNLTQKNWLKKRKKNHLTKTNRLVQHHRKTNAWASILYIMVAVQGSKQHRNKISFIKYYLKQKRINTSIYQNNYNLIKYNAVVYMKIMFIRGNVYQING